MSSIRVLQTLVPLQWWTLLPLPPKLLVFFCAYKYNKILSSCSFILQLNYDLLHVYSFDLRYIYMFLHWFWEYILNIRCGLNFKEQWALFYCCSENFCLWEWLALFAKAHVMQSWSIKYQSINFHQCMSTDVHLHGLLSTSSTLAIKTFNFLSFSLPFNDLVH